MTVAWFAVRRLGRAAVVMWAAFTLTFVVLRVLPGDPVALMLSGRNGFDTVPPEQVAAVRTELGFDRPFLVQYADALTGVLNGDFGRSIQTGQPVSAMIAESLPPTLAVGVTALVLALVVGAVLGVLANLVKSPVGRQVLRSVPSFSISLPPFWVGLVLIQLLSLRLRLLPSIGDQGVASIVLPAVTLAIPGAALVAQVLGKGLQATLRDPYVETIRATGAGTVRILLGHAVRNAAIPAVTVVGLLVGGLLGGAVVVETVFSRPGMGRIIQAAVGNQDLPVVQGVVIVASMVFVLTNLVTDLLYPLLDPRIRSTGRLVTA